MWKPCRSVLTWLATAAGLQAVVDQAHDRRIEQSGYQRGYAACEKKMREEMPPVFATKPEYIPVIPLAHDATVRILSLPQSAVYEPPDKQTGPSRPIRGNPLIPMENVIGPHETQSLPAVDETGRYQQIGKLHMKAYRHFYGKSEAGE